MTNDVLLVGIVGGSRSGKTSFAHELIRRLGLAQVETLLLDMDAYYAPLAQVRERFGERPINWDHPHAFDLELMASHLADLKRNQAISKPSMTSRSAIVSVGASLSCLGAWSFWKACCSSRCPNYETSWT